MAFDQTTRNRLARFVTDARTLLSDEFTRQLQHEYGLNPKTGEETDLAKLSHLNDARRETAVLLRETMEHYLSGSDATGVKARKEVLDRIVREQAFTVLNRLCALRMAEARGLLIESVARGYQSKGFQLYGRLAGTALRETGDAYRVYLFSIFDEFALDLPVLFDRFGPEGRLFPREATLLDLLTEINHSDIDALWAEDETIGWIYQYFNSSDERREMRKGGAPRNSRELAVRNQFFTPRYVVEFLTDNTLGRIWYEMTQGETVLKEECRYLVRRPNEVFLQPGEEAPETPQQEELSHGELLRQPVYIPHRPLKDPRDLKMLDPACGSMHFGLYAFDLFERVYEEAWEIEGTQGVDALARPKGLAPLHAVYPDRDTFLRDVPRLIVERNIHGIDIDPRAVQIAGLSLWLRAQRSWQRQGLKPKQRPVIQRSNIVCAEPMPGEKSFLEEFNAKRLSATREDQLLGQLMHRLFDAMELAGEAGSLLRIEVEIAGAVAAAKEQWLALTTLEQGGLFTEEANDPRNSVNGGFWEEVEERIYAALRSYSEEAEHANGYRRRLFANDASQGFAFIDVCRRRYDVVLMNPPFGDAAQGASEYLQSRYGAYSKNLLCAFVVRGREMAPGCAVGAITDSTWLKKADYEEFRSFMLSEVNRLQWLVDLGWGVLDDANVATCCFSSLPSAAPNPWVTSIRLIETDVDDKDKELSGALSDLANTGFLYIRGNEFFNRFPRRAIAYETPDALVRAFREWKALEPAFATTRRGYTPGDTFRFFRCWWEVPIEQRGKAWWTLNNGGAFAPLVGDGYFTALHESEWASYRPLAGFRLESEEWFGTPGLGWGKRTDFMYAYPLPERSIFSNEGHSVFLKQSSHTWPLLAYLNSSVGQTLLNLFCGQHKLAGYVADLPTPDLESEPLRAAGEIAEEVLQGMAESLARFETAETFVCAIGTAESPSFVARQLADRAKWYEEGLCKIDEAVGRSLPWLAGSGTDALFATPRPKSTFSKQVASNNGGHEVVSYLLGSVLGRWDVRLATGEQPTPRVVNPFAPLPACTPGQLQNHHGLPITREDVAQLEADGHWSYPIEVAWGGILVDDPGHILDIEALVHGVLQAIWHDRGDSIEREVCGLLTVRTLREYFRKSGGFFADHLKRYSKSRRQAPIYWPLTTASGSYTLWVYYHRLSDQTLYVCVNDFVEPRLTLVTEDSSRLRAKSARTSAEEKELERLSALEAELREFRDELLRIAKFWKPNLNDGVQITAAPLWKLFQHKPWQKKLKETWDKLGTGEYDWAHLAYSIWPDRVREACRTDKSLAIAHGLEDLYEEPKTAPKRRGRKKQEEEGEEFAALDLEE
jgi:hypothetical protein